MMKVILESDVTGLGEEGSIVNVSPGYARNYLFPRKKAIQYNTQNMSILKSRMKSIEHRRNERRTMHASIKERLESETLAVSMVSGEKGHLYGAVTAHMISELLEEKGISIPKLHIILPDGHSIKNIGVYPVIIKLYHGVQAQCTISVTDKNKKNTQDLLNGQNTHAADSNLVSTETRDTPAVNEKNTEVESAENKDE